MARTLVVGGGVAGLVAAYDLARAGEEVIVFERDAELGGLAASLSMGSDLRIEKYYHFICRPDRAYLDLLRELGLGASVRWAVTKMGLFYRGRTYTIGDPLHLLAFPHLSPLDKARFLAAAARGVLGSDEAWRSLENVPARDWLVQAYGQRAYDVLYEPLLRLKFRPYADVISAAWMWARFYRLGRSRTLLGQEYVGYVEGGTDRFVQALAERLRERGVVLRVGSPVERIVVDRGRVRGVACGGETITADRVLSTVPIPRFLELMPAPPGPYFDNLRSLNYIGVNVMLLRLRRPFSRYFWMNVSDPDMELAGVIEYTNLNRSATPDGSAILYVPQYLPSEHKLYAAPDGELLDLYVGYFRRINPSFDRSWVVDCRVHRDRFAQPVCERGFASRIPAMATPVEGLYLTDSYQIHPGDRTVSDSVRLGRTVARLMWQR